MAAAFSIMPSSTSTLSAIAGHRAGQRVAAEGAAVVAGLEDAQHFLVGEHRRDRVEAAGERLADHGQVGLDALVLLGQQLAGAAQAGLDFVGDQR